VGDRRDAYRDLVGRSGGKIPFGIPRYRWKGTIKIDLQQVGWGGVDSIDLDQDREQVADAFECGNEPSGSVKCGEFLD